MADAAASDAARTLSRARWGDQRLRSIVGELERRRDELAAEQIDRLRTLVEQEETP